MTCPQKDYLLAYRALHIINHVIALFYQHVLFTSPELPNSTVCRVFFPCECLLRWPKPQYHFWRNRLAVQITISSGDINAKLLFRFRFDTVKWKFKKINMKICITTLSQLLRLILKLITCWCWLPAKLNNQQSQWTTWHLHSLTLSLRPESQL